MKKIVYSLVFVSILSVTCSSCVKTCYTCSIGIDSSKLCESDYASKEEYQEQIKITKALGYTCK